MNALPHLTLATALLLVGCHEDPPPPGRLPAPANPVDGFEGAQPLADWTVTETNDDDNLATWEVLEDESAPEGSHLVRVLASNEGLTFNLLMTRQSFDADVDVSVSLRSDSGEEDQGGGVLWRAQSHEDYYVTRWNPLENNLRAYKVVAGKRTKLASADLEANATRWHQIRASAVGKKIVVYFDGEPLLDFEDETFAASGMAGLWTKADASVSFDAFLAE